MDVKHEKGKLFSINRMLNNISVKGLAYFALKSSPNIRIYKWSLFLVLFTFKPFPNALIMNVLYRALAGARADDGVINRVVVSAEANTTSLFIIKSFFTLNIDGHVLSLSLGIGER